MMSASKEFCFVTICTESFLAGTLVTLHSFQQHNRWFNGDIVILYDSLSVETQQILVTLVPELQFVQVDNTLQSQLEALKDVFPDFSGKIARLYVIEIFKLSNYSKVFYCDSDILFKASVQLLFETDALFGAVADGATLHGLSRNRQTFKPEQRGHTLDALTDTFSSGFMLIDQAFCTLENYQHLVQMLVPETWQDVQTEHLDQLVLNLKFSGVQTLLAPATCYLLGHKEVLAEHHQCHLSAAQTIHYNRPIKPWELTKIVSGLTAEQTDLLAFQQWLAAYLQCAQVLHLRHRWQQL